MLTCTNTFNLSLSARNFDQILLLQENKEYNPKGVPTSHLSSGEARVLDRFQVNNLVLFLNLVRFYCQDFVKILHVSYFLQSFKVAPAISHMVMLQQPSFINRLIGTDDDQLTSIRSPYTSRLKYLLVDFTCI